MSCRVTLLPHIPGGIDAQLGQRRPSHCYWGAPAAFNQMWLLGRLPRRCASAPPRPSCRRHPSPSWRRLLHTDFIVTNHGSSAASREESGQQGCAWRGRRGRRRGRRYSTGRIGHIGPYSPSFPSPLVGKVPIHLGCWDALGLMQLSSKANTRQTHAHTLAARARWGTRLEGASTPSSGPIRDTSQSDLHTVCLCKTVGSQQVPVRAPLVGPLAGGRWRRWPVQAALSRRIQVCLVIRELPRLLRPAASSRAEMPVTAHHLQLQLPGRRPSCTAGSP